jgi:hypothetical protein
MSGMGFYGLSSQACGALKTGHPTLIQAGNAVAGWVFGILVERFKAHRSHIMCAQPDVLGLFLVSVGSFSDNVGLSALIFSDNLGTKPRCYRAERFMFSGYYS